VIISKFNDYSNHNYTTIEFQDIITKSKFNVHFINERSGFYNLSLIGDTVNKKKGSLEVISSNQNIKSPLIYDCDDERTK
jgi:competence transcription factor ComK